MPIYEYVCEDCGNKFELLTSTRSPIGKGCPECFSSRTKLVPSVPAWRPDKTIRG